MSGDSPSSCHVSITTPVHPGQQELDDHIEKLEREVIDLKRRRNELSPVSRIPGEVLSEILFSATSSPTTYGIRVDEPRDVGYIQTLCHVSYAWRSLALGCPSLWYDIDVQPGASAQRLNFLLDHAHPIPLSLRVQENIPKQIRFESSPGPLTTLKQVLSERSPISFHQVLFRGTSPFLKDCFTISPKKDAIHTIRIINTGQPQRSGDAMLDTQDGLLSGGVPSLRTLDLVGCTIPLTSRILFSPNLTRLVLDAPRQGNVRDVLEMLRHTTQLQTFRMACSREPWPPDSTHPPFEVRLPRLMTLSLVGHSALLLQIIEKLRLSSAKIDILLVCSLPAASPPLQTGGKLFAALGNARAPSVKHWEDNNQPFSPKKLTFQPPASNLPLGIGSCPLYVCHVENPSSGGGPHSWVDVQLFHRETGAVIDCGEWHPMFTACSPEDLLQTMGWSFANLTAIRIASLHDTYPRTTFWKLISMIANLERIVVEAIYTPDFIPFLYTTWDQALEVHTAFPFARLQHIKVTGTVSPDTGPESLLEPIANALQMRHQLASHRDSRTEDAQSLDLLELTDCLFPPSESVLLAFPPTLVKHVSWKTRPA